MEICIKRVDCDAIFEKELKKVLRKLSLVLSQIKVRDRTFRDVHKILLYSDEKKLIEYIKSEEEFNEIRRDVVKQLKFKPFENIHFGIRGYAFLSVINPQFNFSDECVILEEIVHSLTDVKIKEGIVDTMQKIVENEVGLDPLGLASGARLWSNVKGAVTHYYVFKILMAQTTSEIRQKMKDFYNKHVGETLEEIRKENYDSEVCAFYLPELVLAEELGAIRLQKLDRELFERHRHPYDQISELLRECDWQSIPERGSEIMLEVFKIQFDMCKGDIRKNIRMGLKSYDSGTNL